MICKECKQDKLVSEFHIRKTLGIPRRECKQCFRWKSKNKWKYDKEDRRQKSREYIRNNKHKLEKYRKQHVFKMLANYSNQRHKRKNLGKITPFELWKIAKKQKLICPLTGVKLNRSNISVDHITPMSKNGTNTALNVRLVHKEANFIKGTKTDSELLVHCKEMYKQLSYHLERLSQISN